MSEQSTLFEHLRAAHFPGLTVQQNFGTGPEVVIAVSRRYVFDLTLQQVAQEQQRLLDAVVEFGLGISTYGGSFSVDTRPSNRTSWHIDFSIEALQK